MSVLSYLVESEVPTHTVLSSDPFRLIWITLTCSVSSKEPAARLESGASSTTSRRSASSPEATAAATHSQLSTSHRYACWKVVLTVITPWGLGILSLM